MRASLENRKRVGNKQRADLVRPLIGIHNFDRHALINFDHRVIGVGESEDELTRGHCFGNPLVAAENLYIVGFESAEEIFRLLIAPEGKQTGRLRGSRAE